MKVHVAVVAALVLGLARLGYAAQLDADTEKFLRDTAMSSMGEVELSRWVMDRAGSDVSKFAKTMVDDHSKMLADLKTLTDKYSLKLPDEKMTSEQAALKDRWEKMASAKFDRDYLTYTLNEHQKDLDLFNKYSQESKNEDVKTFVDKYLPHLQNHLQMAKELEGKLSKSAGLDQPPPGTLDTSWREQDKGLEVSEQPPELTSESQLEQKSSREISDLEQREQMALEKKTHEADLAQRRLEDKRDIGLEQKSSREMSDLDRRSDVALDQKTHDINVTDRSLDVKYERPLHSDIERKSDVSYQRESVRQSELKTQDTRPHLQPDVTLRDRSFRSDFHSDVGFECGVECGTCDNDCEDDLCADPCNPEVFMYENDFNATYTEYIQPDREND